MFIFEFKLQFCLFFIINIIYDFYDDDDDAV